MDRYLVTEAEGGNSERFAVVHARILRHFPDLVTELGGDPRRLLARVGLQSDKVLDGGSHTTYRQTVQLMELAAATLNCPDFGMRLARRQNDGMFGPLGLVMKNSKTLGGALEYVAEHPYAHSLAARIWQRRSHCGKHLFVGHDILLDGIPNRAQAMEHILLLGHLAAAAITDGHARIRRAHFRHQPVSPLKTYRRYFGCEVRFGQNEDGIFFSERDLACPVVAPDAQAYQAATTFIDAQFTRRRPPLHAQVRGLIKQFLGTVHCSNDRIAVELGIHPRTLHRRLNTEGTSFQKIKDEVRRDAMLYYLEQTDLDLTQISEKLGFAEQSVMTRTCRRWFAAPPTRVRSQRPSPLAVG